jgi:ABC-type branched-subunit amino acid transport system substrate-binding protein
VGVEVHDSRRDPPTAEAAVTAMAGTPEVVAILGPVFSNVASSAAVEAQVQGIPLVSPTANANGIAARGDMVFQVNPDYETRGRAMARYAVLTKQFRRIALLAPSDTFGRQLAEAFLREVRLLDATIVATEWYMRGMSDLKPQLQAIRRAGMMLTADPLLAFGGNIQHDDLMKLAALGVPLARLDSLMAAGATIPGSDLLGPDARALVDSLQLSVSYDESKIDSLEYPVTGIDAIYAPISSPAEIGVVSSQIIYFNFQTQILGSGEWNDIAELDANKRYCNGVMFETDSFIDSASASYQKFAMDYRLRYQKRPSRNVLFGYDAASVVLHCIGQGANTRRDLARALAGVSDYRGLRSRIGFSSGRVNMWLTIVQYANDRIQRVSEVSSP